MIEVTTGMLTKEITHEVTRTETSVTPRADLATAGAISIATLVVGLLTGLLLSRK